MECFDQSSSNNYKQNCSLSINTPHRYNKKCKSARKFPHKLPQTPQHSVSPQQFEVSIPSCIPQKSLKQEDVQKLMVYRKHEYQNKQFTQIYDMKTDTTTIRSKAKIKYTLSSFNQIAHFGPYLVNISPLSTQNSYKKTEWKELINNQKNCNCLKSQCRQNYCYCLQMGLSCTQDCMCRNCKNSMMKPVRSEQLTSKKNNLINTKSKNSKAKQKDPQSNRQSIINRCSCKKSGNCLKSLCGCHRQGINCCDLCQCINCRN